MIMKQNAFTLVELLVVVAIISILATISLPNYQHALVKAKVSSVTAEMQSLSTAIEAYALDYNIYPLDGNDYPDKSEDYYDEKRIQKVLTTPTAYISQAKFPHDLFHEREMVKEDLNTNRLFKSKPPYPYIYMSQGNYMTNKGAPRAYYIFSIGPNYWFDNSSENEDNLLVYSSSNGIISDGDVVRKGP